jgi:hypothetical protein
MPLPIFAVPMALHLVAATVSSVPRLDVTPSCRAAAAAQAGLTDRMQACIESEKMARDELAQEWTKFSSVDRSRCVRLMMDFDPAYTELQTCLDIANDAKKLPKEIY